MIDPISSKNNSIYIPYWKWTNKRGIPDWMHSFTPAVKNIDGSIKAKSSKSRQNIDYAFIKQSDIDKILKNNNFIDFTEALEGSRRIPGPHNTGHGVLRGVMNNTRISPLDPMFWLHHANVDRIWAKWQAKNSKNRNDVAILQNKNKNKKKWNILKPFGVTIANASKLTDYHGYKYEKP